MLLEKIKRKEVKIGVIGLGYVGLPLALEFAKAGFKYGVLGIDLDQNKIRSLNQGKSYIQDVSDFEVKKFIKSGHFFVMSDYSKAKKTDCLIICVPTPLKKDMTPDLAFILKATKEIQKNLRPSQLIVLESTSYPGTTREVILPLLSKTGLVCGKDFYLAVSSERIDPGNRIYKIKNIPKVVAGITPNCLKNAIALYSQIIEKVIPVSKTESAEMTKLLENTFRLVNISLVNEMVKACEKFKIDIWEIIEAAKTKPFGFMPFYPGVGVGGHCISIDPTYLFWKLKKLNFESKMIKEAVFINQNMPFYVAERIATSLKKRNKKLKNAKILILGITYKPDVRDLRESKSLELLEILKKNGAKVFYHDPFFEEIKINNHLLLRSKLCEDLLKKTDCVVVATAHSSYDFKWIVEKSNLIFDTRCATKGIKANPKIVKL